MSSSPPKTHKMNRSPPTQPTPRIYNKTALSAGACCIACSGCIAGSIGCLVGTAACTNCIKGTFCPKKVEIPIRPPSYNPITNKTIYDFDDVIIYVTPRLNFTIGDNRIGEFIKKKFNLPTNVEYADYNKLKSFLDLQIEKLNSERELERMIKKKTIGGRTKRTKRTNGKKRRTNKR